MLSIEIFLYGMEGMLRCESQCKVSPRGHYSAYFNKFLKNVLQLRIFRDLTFSHWC
jgi:hypothetical protein